MGVSDKVDVPLLDLQPQYSPLKADIMAAIEEVCDSQYFILGPRVAELEALVADYCQSAEAIGVSSGTDALLVALMALDIGPGDEVITTPCTFFATGGTIARVGARPIFCDIDPETFNLSPVAVDEFIHSDCDRQDGGLVNRRTGGSVRAIMPVHLFGQLADMDRLGTIGKENGLAVVEDAAQAIGSEDANGKRAGSFGDVGCFSFFPSKNLGGFGDAGMCTVADSELAERIRVLRVHGGKPKYHHALIGGNFRLDALQAAVLKVKLPHLDSWTAQRQRNAGYYDSAFAEAGLTEHVTRPICRDGFRHIYNQYVVRVPHRDALKAHLAEAGVSTEIYYPISLHSQECFRYLGHAPDDCPESSRAAREALALPIYPGLTERQLAHIVTTIGAFYE
jgi:dTDP-4-amino-4,6-dideoxygalactose transaminase